MATLSPQPMSALTFQWDPKNLEIKTKSVEKTLEPLVTQVTTLVSQKGPSNCKKGRSKKAKVLSAAVAKAIDHFITEGEKIANENVEIRNEMFAAVEEVRKTGNTMKTASDEFAGDPCSSMKRGAMIRAARALLGAVTRLLILADMVDVHNLLRALRTVQSDLDRVRDASSEKELRSAFKDLGSGVMELSGIAGRRQLDLKDPYSRERMASARAMLKTNTLPLLTASKVYVRHPELAAARANRDYVLRQVCDAVDQISGVAQSKVQQNGNPYDGPGELANALDEFDIRVMDGDLPGESNRRQGPSLEERLESIISGAALLADSNCTRDDRRDRIVEECNSVRQALQNLLTETMKNMGNTDKNDNMNIAIDQVCTKTTDLRRQLRRAVVDHLSDTFFDRSGPLFDLIEAAKAGKIEDVENEYGRRFIDHAMQMIEVANLACSMSNNEEGVKFVRTAAGNIESLYPQVLNAARILSFRPDSKVALENMDVFKDSWLKQTKLLVDSIDDIIAMDDFLVVTENHILEDVKSAIKAIEDGNIDMLHESVRRIIGRVHRLTDVVSSEMERYEPGQYTDRVLETISVLQDQTLVNFIKSFRNSVNKMEQNPDSSLNKDEKNIFANSAGMVYDGVKDVRQAVLLNNADPDYETYDMDNSIYVGYNNTDINTVNRTSYSEYDGDQRSDRPSSFVGQDDVQRQHIEDSDDRAKMKMVLEQMPEQKRAEFNEHVANFFVERKRFEREVAKWDDSGNEIIVLSKQMCMIMMEMTDFTRGRGPLKNTMDVINAAKKISEAGSNLDRLCKEIATLCVESASKKDLLAYLQRITLYCHQLNITSKVKADVQNISGELIVSGLDSATSLIQAAKNLMNAVVSAVKASYVASTKYKSGSVVPINIEWRIRNTIPVKIGERVQALGPRISQTVIEQQLDNATGTIKRRPPKPNITWKMRAPDKKPLVKNDDPTELRAHVRRSERHQKIEPVSELSKFTDA